MNLGKSIIKPIKEYVIAPIKTIVSNRVNDNVWDKSVKEIMKPVRLIILRTNLNIDKNEIR